MRGMETFELTLKELEAKFLRLLETDRGSEEFERLYREVDQELGALAWADESDAVRAS